jgi:hypothetical protein
MCSQPFPLCTAGPPSEPGFAVAQPLWWRGVLCSVLFGSILLCSVVLCQPSPGWLGPRDPLGKTPLLLGGLLLRCGGCALIFTLFYNPLKHARAHLRGHLRAGVAKAKC